MRKIWVEETAAVSDRQLPTSTLQGMTQGWGSGSSRNFFSLACCHSDLPWYVIFTPSQFCDTGPFSSTNIPRLLSTGPFIPKAPSPPWSCLFVLQEYFWVFSLVRHVNTTISRGVSPKIARAVPPWGLRVLKMILHCWFKVKAAARLQSANNAKLRQRVELISLEIWKYWPFFKSFI